MFKIVASSKYGIEDIDEADTLQEAHYLRTEYALAFGKEFSISVKKVYKKRATKETKEV